MPRQSSHPETMVLVVDDDFMIRRAIAETLDDAGYQVVSAASGRDALAYLRKRRESCAVILLDLKMPDINGVEFRELQRADPTVADVPVVVCSAYITQADVDYINPVAVLPKPFRAEQLVDVIRQSCNDKRSTSDEPPLQERAVGQE